MRSLEAVAEQIRGNEIWGPELAVVTAVAAELETMHPSFLVQVAAKWEEPYLRLAFTHQDGTVFEVTQGDGYTEIFGGGVDYKGYLEPSSLVEVIEGALRGHLVYVCRARIGYRVGDYFQVAGRGAERFGDRKGPAGMAPFLLRSIPGLRESVRRTSISFERTTAVSLG